MLLLILFQYFSKADSPKSHGQNLLRRLQVKLHRCHSRMSGIFLKNQKDCGQAAMTESDNDVALLMNSLVITKKAGQRPASYFKFSMLSIGLLVVLPDNHLSVISSCLSSRNSLPRRSLQKGCHLNLCQH